MDPKEFERITGVKSPVGDAPQQPTPEAQTPQPEAPGLELDADQMQNLLGSIAGDGSPEPQPTAATTSTEDILRQGSAASVAEVTQSTKDSKLSDLDNPAEAFSTGALRGVFETKDFLFGDTPPEQQSAFRQALNANDAALKEESPIIGGLSSGIGQFAVAMLGLGKAGVVAKALPYVGEAVGAVEGMKGGSVVLESAKAALAGAIAFDPHEARLSNLIQDTPLANPISEWLAAKPGDSAAWGRVKNAMESLGMDAAIIGALKVGGSVWKRLKAGDTAGASRTITEFEAQRAAEMQADAGDVQKVSPDAPVSMDEGPAQVSKVDEVPPAADLANPAGQGPEGIHPTTQEAAGQQAALADDIEVTPVANPTAAMEQTGVAKPQTFKNQVEFAPEEISEAKPAETGIGPTTKPGLLDELTFTLENAEKDWDALSTHDTWSEVLGAGKRLGPDMGTFYNRFRTDNELIDMIDLAVVGKAEELEAKGFRVRLSDEKLQRQVQAFASLANVDPAGLMGILQQAGEASKTLTAKMVVVGSLTAKTFQDASLMAMRLRMGDWTEFGGREAMEQEIAKRFSLATTLLKLTDDIRAQGGRTLRANRGKPFDPAMFEGLSRDRFYELLAEAQGNPEKLKYLADPKLYDKLLDTVAYLRISSLISGWTTQAINVMGTGYMVAARPLERILGGVWEMGRHPVKEMQTGVSRGLIKENLKQYAYMGNALWDGFKMATKAFVQNESVLRPHSSEAYAGASWQVPGTQAIGQNYFKAWDSIPNLIHNALSVPLTAGGVPSRALGGVDELAKQIVYRSKLMAHAHMEATEQALEAGLRGRSAQNFVASFVKQKLDRAFDDMGRGLDPDALREANIATGQQDLLPGTLGKGVQTLIASDKTKLTRLILPFVKTPTNYLRYGWKMTPFLNLAQSEYRAMLWGHMGPEAKAQAVGQVTMGGLFMGAAAYLASQGMLTGGGPSDPRVRAQLLATGYRPYSITIKNDDGTTTYIPYNRMDPVALPFGIISDIQDAIHIVGDDYENNPAIMQAIGALGISLAKQFTSRTYLLSLNQALEALSEPDRRGEAFFGNMAASLVPFSAATRQMSSDPYMRDARHITDKMLQVIPGLSETLPPRYNWLGQPIVNRQGLWTDDNGTLVDKEVQRLSLLPEGSVISAPNPVWNKVDLRDITMTTGENAYQKYQELAGRPSPKAKTLREQVANRMRTEGYQRAPDGDVGTRGTKLWLLNQIVSKYREAAGKRIRADKNVRDALMQAQRKVADHYKHLREPVGEEQKGGLQAILDGFGAGSN